MQLKTVAREQAAGNGESDLRRMKRQFASLKNTFILYDVKQSFIEGNRPIIFTLASYFNLPCVNFSMEILRRSRQHPQEMKDLIDSAVKQANYELFVHDSHLQGATDKAFASRSGR